MFILIKKVYMFNNKDLTVNLHSVNDKNYQQIKNSFRHTSPIPHPQKKIPNNLFFLCWIYKFHAV